MPGVSPRFALVAVVAASVLAPGTSTRDAIGVGVDGRARLDSLQLVGTNPIPLRFAVGGAPILRDSATLPGVDAKTLAVRTDAGVSCDGRHLYLVVLDGISATNTGMTLADLAAVLEGFGARDGVNLDGGGSSTCAVKLPGSSTVTVVNDHPGGVAKRAVANSIGVFRR